MSRHPDPVGAYRQAVAENHPPFALIRAARECPTLSVNESVPALLATTLRGDNLFERSLERWLQRYYSEVQPSPSLAEIDLVRGALATIERNDATSRIGAETLESLFELRGLEYARAAVVRWAARLPAD